VTRFGDQAVLLRRNVWRYFDGLTDDELHWEPAPGMWGMRLKSEVRTDRTPDEMPPGDHWIDVFREEPDPVPLTTIAWRLVHLTFVVGGLSFFLADVPPGPMPTPRYDADGALDVWRGVLDRFVDVVQSLSDERLATPAPIAGPKATIANVVSHTTLEIAFHAAEVGTMRHLYRQRAAAIP
jgi:hypothetical protein